MIAGALRRQNNCRTHDYIDGNVAVQDQGGDDNKLIDCCFCLVCLFVWFVLCFVLIFLSPSLSLSLSLSSTQKPPQDQSGKIVSREKNELIHITDQFNIQVRAQIILFVFLFCWLN